MPKFSKVQFFVLVGILFLTVLLFIAKRKPSVVAIPEVEVVESTIDSYVANDKLSLTEQQRQQISDLERLFQESDTDKKDVVLDSLIERWSFLKKPVSAAYYSEQKAEILGKEAWEKAGSRYFIATHFIDPAKRNPIFERAIRCFEKAIDFDKNNIDAKINLAACYVEGTADPMKGISMLKEIEKTDSNNINLQLYFAVFSEKSGQYDKVISRYEKVLKIDSTYIEAYLHLADAYENEGDNEMAIKQLNNYVNRVEEENIKIEVNNYISKLSLKMSSGEKKQL